MTHFSHRVVLQKKAYIPDQQGGYTLTWSTVGQYWANIKLLGYNKKHPAYQEKNGLMPKPYYLLTLRREIAVRGDMRVQWRGAPYQLISYPVLDPTGPWINVMIQPEGEVSRAA